VVRDEVEENLHVLEIKRPSIDIERIAADYRRLIQLTNPERVPYPTRELVRQNRHLIRHEADVPVLLSAMASRPDWVLTHNTKHFNLSVAQRSGLRIGTPVEFFRELSTILR
jgi:hypothetical protein